MHTHGSLCKLKLDTTLLYLLLDTTLCKETKNHAHSRLATLTMQLSCKEHNTMQRNKEPCTLTAHYASSRLGNSFPNSSYKLTFLTRQTHHAKTQEMRKSFSQEERALTRSFKPSVLMQLISMQRTWKKEKKVVAKRKSPRTKALCFRFPCNSFPCKEHPHFHASHNPCKLTV